MNNNPVLKNICDILKRDTSVSNEDLYKEIADSGVSVSQAQVDAEIKILENAHRVRIAKPFNSAGGFIVSLTSLDSLDDLA